MRHTTITYLLLILLVVAVGGFFMVLNSIATLEGRIENIELGLDLQPAGEVITEGKEDPDGKASPEEGLVTIPTAIIFETQSGVRLQPQKNLPVIVEGVSKSAEGDVVVSLKVFTSEASSYSALEAENLFELLDLTSGNRRPAEVSKIFRSMPPRSVVSGKVNFTVSPDQESIILQINTEGSASFYRFNFETKSYEETVLG